MRMVYNVVIGVQSQIIYDDGRPGKEKWENLVWPVGHFDAREDADHFQCRLVEDAQDIETLMADTVDSTTHNR